MKKDKVFKTSAEKLGGHWHVKIYSSNATNHTYANIGTLVMDENDYLAFTHKFNAAHEITEDFL